MLSLLRKLRILPWLENRADAPLRGPVAVTTFVDPTIRSGPMLMEELEPRILHSADLSPLFDGGANLASMPDHQPLLPESSDVEPATLTEDTNSSTELVFVDTATPDYQALLDDLVSASDGSRRFEIVLIDGNRDGIEQMTEAVAGRSNIDAIHIVSHGSEGELSLGTGRITLESMTGEHADALATIGRSLSETADILIYGCNFGQGESGRQAAATLAQLTGADVAASDDLTGHASLGGDWVLEYQIGEIENTVTFSAQTWHGVLATFTVDTFSDTVDANPGDGIAQDAFGNTSLRAAIMEANALAGADAIDLAAGTYTLTIAGAYEDAGAQGDLDIASEITITGAGAGTTIIDGGGLDRVFDIRPTGDATITGLTIQNGGTVAQGGGIMLSGGASGARLFLDDVTLSNNAASSEGGAIYNDGVLTMINSEISANNTASLGGGLFNAQDAKLTGVTISGNSADFGGAISNSDPSNSLSLINVTISGNTATNQGGGIYTSQLVTLTNVTIAYNSAPSGGGIVTTGGAGEAVLKNSILADNIGGNANTTLTALGNNIDTDGTSGIPVTLSSDLKLDPLLSKNGGPTRTHALLPGSAAINTGNAGFAPTTDQRHLLRGDGKPDIGAYELDAIPVGGFWISTEADVAASSGVKGLDAWVDGDVLQFGGPDLVLEPGGSDGTLSLAFNLDQFAVDGAAEVDAIHYVTRDITVGSSTTMDLKAGDVLFSTVLIEDFSSTNALSAVQDSDLVVFRPDSADDYSSGTFYMLLDESSISAGNDWLDLGGISLVEQDTLVGDKTLSAGTFILVEGAAASRMNIQLFTPVSVGSGSTDGSLELLLDISAPAIGLTDAIDGLELIEKTTSVGGAVLTPGTILISQDGDAGVYTLNITATEFGSGSNASVTVLLNGNAIGLETAAENAFALTLVVKEAGGVNTAPVVAAPAASLSATEQTPLAIHGTGFEAKDDDAGSGDVLTTLSVGEGTITVVEGDTGVTITGGNGSAAVTLTGTIAEINTLLMGTGTGTITYLNNADAPRSSTTLTVTVNDQGNTGTDPGLSGDAVSEEGSASVTINVTAVNDAPVFTSSGPYSVDENASAGTVVGTVEADDPDIQGAGTTLIISEIMFNPESSEPRWEWIEVYNPTDSTIDLAGYVLDDINTLAHSAANIAAGSVAPGSTAVLFNADEISAANFAAAWSTGINQIAVSGWANLQLNNDGDTVSLWASFADYSGDHQTHANAIVTVSYDDVSPWPVPDSESSIYLTDLSADPADPANWALSTVGAATPLGGVAYKSKPSGSNSGEDVGSPGDGGAGSTLTYAITGNVNPDGDGNAAFTIDALTGVISVNDADDLDFESTSSLAITVEVSDGTLATSTLVTIDLNNVNDAPSVTAPASISVTEDVASAITGISFADVDAAAGNVVATFSVAQGTLAATSSAGVSVGGSATNLTLTGSIADINTFISASKLTYTTAPNSTGAVNLAVSINDGGNTGSGGPLASAVSNVTLNVTAVNDAPTLTAFAAPVDAGNEDTRIEIRFSELAAQGNEADADGSVNAFVIKAVSNGTLRIGSSAVTATAWVAGSNDVVTAGRNAYWTPPSQANGTIDAFTVVARDNDGARSNAAVQVQVTVNAVNDAPSAGDVSYVIDEDSTLDSDSAWFDNAWTLRRTLSFENTTQTENLTDFAVLVTLDSTNIDYSQTQDNGEDLRFVDGDGTVLAHEIETWNESGTSFVWVKVPQIDGSSNTDFIWMYYGNAAAPDGQDPSTVWDSNYVGVWHLAEDQAGTGSAGVYKDSTANNNDGNDGVTATGKSGQIGDGQQFSGAGDTINVPHDASLNLTGEMSISFWIKPTQDTTAFNRIVEKGLWGYQTSYYFGLGNGTNDLSFYLNNTAVFDTPDNLLSVNEWQYAAVTFDGSGNATLFVNSAEVGSGTYTGPITGNTDSLYISVANSTYDFTGFIDEVRIANTARSAGWIAAQYASYTGALVEVGHEQSVAGVLGNDVDADGDPLNAVLVTGPANAASFSLNADGSFSYTPVADFNGVDSFTYMANDGAANSNIATVTIAVSAVNDPPTVSAPASISVTEDVATAITGISFADVDATSGSVVASFSVAQGTLAATSSAGVTVGGTATDLTLTGSLANINNFINASKLTYTTVLNDTSAVNLAVSVNDGGNSGSGGSQSSAVSNVTLNVSGVNDAPTLTVPVAQNTTTDNAVVFSTANANVISISDIDAGSNLVEVTLSAMDGTLTLGGTTGLIFTSGTGTGDASMIFRGTIADANAALQGLTYDPTAGYSGSAGFYVTANDLGNSGSGAAKSTTDMVVVNVSFINSAPILSGANDLSAISEDPAANAGTPVSTLIAGMTSDANSGALDGIAVTAVDNTNGTWEYSTDGGSSWTAFGAPSEASARLLGSDVDSYVRFVPDANYTGTVSGGITFRAWDRTSGAAAGLADTLTNGGTTAFSAATASASIAVNPVNDAPDVTAPASISVTEDVASAITGISFTDVDAASGNVVATFSVTQGTLAATSSSGVSVGGSATNLSLTGSIADINAFINASNLTYTSALNDTSAVNLAVSINDGGNTGSGGPLSSAVSNVTLNVSAVNDAPSVTAPASISVTEDVASAITGISFADVDAASGNVVATFSVAQGTLAATSGAGVSVGGSATNLTLTGSIADINAFINASNLTYTTAPNNTSAVNLAVSINDGGNTGSGGALASAVSNVTLDVTPVNDVPVGTVNITGIAAEDQVLSASDTLADADGLGAISYHWHRDGVEIPGATTNTYTLTDADVGTTITVEASYTDGEGTFESVSSAAFGPVANVNDAPGGMVTITGTADEGQVLSADAGSISDADGLGTFSYQWLRNGVNISGATASTYVLVGSDVGASVSVQVFYTDGHGTLESVNSVAIGPVATGVVASPTLPPIPPIDTTEPEPPAPNDPPADAPVSDPVTEEPATSTAEPGSALITANAVAVGLGGSGGADSLDAILETSGSQSITPVSGHETADLNTLSEVRIVAAKTGFDIRSFALQQLDAGLDQLTFVVAPSASLPSFGSAANGIDAPEFIRELDHLRDDLEEQNRTASTLMMSNLVATAGLSVGYLFWLLRAEVLLGSLLSSLPAWRLVDPLPVLGRLGDEDDEDDDSLESLVERKNRTAQTTDMKGMEAQ